MRKLQQAPRFWIVSVGFSLLFIFAGYFTAIAQKKDDNGVCKPGDSKCESATEHQDEHVDGGAEEADHDDHEHAKKDEHDDHKTHDEHDEGEKGHAHDEKAEADEHGHDSEGGNVGPDKGILAASEEKGIQLSPEAIKNFEIQTVTLNGQGPWKISKSSVFVLLEEKNIYRLREGFFKRVDFDVIQQGTSEITFRSSELRGGDQVVTKGLGFLNIAEVAAFGGAPEGHSH